MTTGFRRLLFRLSGEDLAGGDDCGIHPGVISAIADEIREVRASSIRPEYATPSTRPPTSPPTRPSTRPSTAPSGMSTSHRGLMPRPGTSGRLAAIATTRRLRQARELSAYTLGATFEATFEATSEAAFDRTAKGNILKVAHGQSGGSLVRDTQEANN